VLCRLLVSLGIVFCLAPRLGHADPVVTAGSGSVPVIVNVGDVFTIPVSITDAVDLIHWQFDLSFDPDILQANTVTEGPFLSSGGSNITLFIEGVIDNNNGTITIVTDSCIACFPGPSGSGVLANIEFEALAPGLSPLDLSNVFLNLDDSGFQVVDGLVCVLDGQVCVAQPPDNGIPEPSTLVLLLGALATWSFYGGAVRGRRQRVAHVLRLGP
jgi:cohesin domain-containing protein